MGRGEGWENGVVRMGRMREGNRGERLRNSGNAGRIDTRAELLHCFTLKTKCYRGDCVRNL